MQGLGGRQHRDPRGLLEAAWIDASILVPGQLQREPAHAVLLVLVPVETAVCPFHPGHGAGSGMKSWVDDGRWCQLNRTTTASIYTQPRRPAVPASCPATIGRPLVPKSPARQPATPILGRTGAAPWLWKICWKSGAEAVSDSLRIALDRDR
ncbi:hypothetical protein BU16DRAFT_544742 [Lophium mytilinum]|uniref:Uncharacterized protein n=1 Tax=Lophium mytilinum TaxID=390894 RepID=A0A6A6QB28_9PEZI|nr:hypothetical protein BU16DRAFT_544742 [Lophium mytilinum]